MNRILIVQLVLIFCLCGDCDSNQVNSDQKHWIGIHLTGYHHDSTLNVLELMIPDLASLGINLLILEVDYHFDFQSHPELKPGNNYITKKAAAEFALTCKNNGIRLIPQFQSFGHQSGSPLLKVYPELDLTPGAFKNNQGIYAREWDPTNPRVNEIVFPMIEEIVEAFDSDGIHVGMDEIFLIGSKYSPNTFGKDPALIFANEINEFHDHFVKKLNLEMFMWADRLLDAKEFPYGIWEASTYGTAEALDLIPTDIVLCDWHYTPRDEYMSIPYFIEKGFKVLPASYRDVVAVEKLINYSFLLEEEMMLGHLFTTWGQLPKLLEYPPMISGMESIQERLFFNIHLKSHSSVDNWGLPGVLIESEDEFNVFYTIDGSEPTKHSIPYSIPIQIDENCRIKARAFKNGKAKTKIVERDIYVHKATGLHCSFKHAPSIKYPTLNTFPLTDGFQGSDSFRDGYWLGFDGVNMDAVFKFPTPIELTKLSFQVFESDRDWIHKPDKIELYHSANGEDYVLIKADKQSSIVSGNIESLQFRFQPIHTQYMQVVLYPKKNLNPKRGGRPASWIFVDEIMMH